MTYVFYDYVLLHFHTVKQRGVHPCVTGRLVCVFGGGGADAVSGDVAGLSRSAYQSYGSLRRSLVCVNLHGIHLRHHPGTLHTEYVP